MNRVLILCDEFPPRSGPRMGYLVKYLSRLGWESCVITGEVPARASFEALTGFAKEVHVIPQKRHRKWNLLHVLPLFWPYDYLRGEHDMLAKARAVAANRKFDVILSSCTFEMFPNNSAHAVAREFDLPLVVDIRDMPAQNPRKPFSGMSMVEKLVFLRSKLGFLGARRSMSVLRAADALVSISPWHVRWLKEHCNENSFLIYNGYDPETFFPVESRPTDCFRIVYTGTLASESSRDYTFLLESVQALHERGVIDPRTFQVVFYSGEVETGNPIRERIASRGIGDFFSFRDFVPSSEVPSILGDASVLLVLASRNGFHGVMTTKFFEYLAVNRPILCVASDEGVLEEAMREAECGCAARSAGEAERFIERLYREWQEKGFTVGTTRADKIGCYSRKFQAEQFADIFRRAIENRGSGAASRRPHT